MGCRQPSGAHRRHGNRSHMSEVVPGQGAILVASRPNLNKKSRWLRCSSVLMELLLQRKVPLTHLGGAASCELPAPP